MKKKSIFLLIIALVFMIPVAVMSMIALTSEPKATLERPEGPCDIYEAGGTPCVAAHSSTRALYAAYNGPLYQVMRQSDGKTLDIGVVQPSEGDAGGYANAVAQDEFCANTYCWITVLYDQSGKENHLIQAPRGAFSGPAMGGANNLPIADMAPITLMGHKVYGIFIVPGMGLRWNDAKGTAVDDQAEGQYWVINGNHYNSGCCYDYGNAETDSRDDGDGTMETTYYGNASSWYRGEAPGPWIMTDQENNLVGCVNPNPNDKYCPNLESISWRFVMATADGEPHHWRSMGGDAQNGELKTYYDGSRIQNDRSSYDPMRKQGAILLGNGGDNSNGSQGTFYEGAMTAPNTFPSVETNQKIQANIVAAKYDIPRLGIAAAISTETPTGLQTFAPRSTQNTTVWFTNTTGKDVKDLTLSIVAPAGWKSVVLSSGIVAKRFTQTLAPGESVNVTFSVTSGLETYNGDLIGKATWSTSGSDKIQSDIVIEKVRNVSPVKINEFRISDGSAENASNTFIELYNAGDIDVDLSNWSLTQHASQVPIFSAIKMPVGAKIPARGFYLLGLSTSGLSVPAKKGETTLFVRSTTGISVGDVVKIGTGAAAETRKVVRVINPTTPDATNQQGGMRRMPVGASTTLWQPLPDGPIITIPVGSTNIPVTSVAGFEVGQKIAIGYGATYPTVSKAIEKYEVVTLTSVGKSGTQAYLSMDAKPGDTNIKVSSVANISVGDKIRLDIDSKGHGIETVTVKSVGTQSVRNTLSNPLKPNEDPGTGLELTAPLKYHHASNMPFSARGTGLTFTPATAYTHSSNEPVQPLVYAITIDQPLASAHEIDDVVLDQKVTTAGYQGIPAPQQWFGGPALASSGNMVLRDAKGLVVDGLNYGSVVDPWSGEGYQALSGASENGCFAPAPGGNRGFRFGASTPQSQPNISTGRYPDGADLDDNERDFHVQNAVNLLALAPAGTNTIKVASLQNFNNGQKLFIGSGSNIEVAEIATIGTAGCTTIGAAATAGSAILPVLSIEGFSVGQIITVGNGTNLEKVVIASISVPRRRMGFGGRNQHGPVATDTIKVTAPLKYAHNVNAQVSGSGITLTKALLKNHESGALIASDLPTPGMPNRYYRKP